MKGNGKFINDNAGSTRNRASITADSGELGALRDEVMQMKMEYEQNAMDQEAKFAEWKRNYKCQVCANNPNNPKPRKKKGGKDKDGCTIM